MLTYNTILAIYKFEGNIANNHEFSLSQIISVQSEASILQKASEEIKKLNDKPTTAKETDNESTKDSIKVSQNSILKAKLQDQVRTGEITPFQAVKKETDVKKILG